MFRLIKFVWYLCGSILILFLSTFGFLLPDLGTSLSEGQVRLTDGQPVSATLRDPPAVHAPPLLLEGLEGLKKDGAGGRGQDPWSHSDLEGSADRRVATELEADRASQVRFRSRVLRTDEAPGRELSRFFRRQREWSGGRHDRAGLQEGLTELQEGYQQAFDDLFENLVVGLVRPRNPFEEALDEGVPEDDPPALADPPEATGEANPASGTETVAPESLEPAESGDPAPVDSGELGSTGVGQSPPAPNVLESPPEPTFDFLVVGAFGGNPAASRVSRARRDLNGDFVLEDGSRISLFLGFIRSLPVFQENEKVLMGDLNGDGVSDLTVVRLVKGVGSSIESFLLDRSGGLVSYASAGLYLQAVQSFALFDFTQDGEPELAVLLEGEPQLFVYQRVNGVWVYLKEMDLPVEPGLLMTAESRGSLRTRSLYVIDNGLDYVVSVSSRQPTAFHFGARTPLNHLRSLEMDLAGRGELTKILVFEFGDQITLAERSYDSLNFFVALETSPGVPQIIIGDYAVQGSRQMVWVR
ncbi:MAG: hypothetical protein ACE5JX_20100 [Acidobacteriota bacterium]